MLDYYAKLNPKEIEIINKAQAEINTLGGKDIVLVAYNCNGEGGNTNNDQIKL